jgi:hypothetical protein
MQWGSGSVNEDKQGRFNELCNALEAVEAFSNNDFNKNLYIQLNVFGRAMFSHIVNLKPEEVKANIFSKISSYSSEGLDLNGTIYKDYIKVGQIYSQYIESKVQPYDDYESPSVNEKTDLNEVVVVNDSTGVSAEKSEKNTAKIENEKSKVATNLINDMLSKTVADICVKQSTFAKIEKYISDYKVDCPAYVDLMGKISEGTIIVVEDELFA